MDTRKYCRLCLSCEGDRDCVNCIVFDHWIECEGVCVDCARIRRGRTDKERRFTQNRMSQAKAQVDIWAAKRRLRAHKPQSEN